jgi:hypothetical protein
MDSRPSDETLLLAVAERDLGAFRTLYERHAGWLAIRLAQVLLSVEYGDIRRRLGYLRKRPVSRAASPRSRSSTTSHCSRSGPSRPPGTRKCAGYSTRSGCPTSRRSGSELPDSQPAEEVAS